MALEKNKFYLLTLLSMYYFFSRLVNDLPKTEGKKKGEILECKLKERLP